MNRTLIFAMTVGLLTLSPPSLVRADTADSPDILVGKTTQELETLQPCMKDQTHLGLCGYTGIASRVYFDKEHSLVVFVRNEIESEVQVQAFKEAVLLSSAELGG